MQTPVSLVVLGASLLAAFALTAQQPDRAAQARALEALRKKMAEMEGAPAPARPQPAPPPASQPAPQPPAAPVPAPTRAPDAARQSEPGFTQAPSANELDTRLRQALDESYGETGAAPAVTRGTAPAAASTDPYAFFGEVPPPSEPPVSSSVFAEVPPPSTLDVPAAIVAEPPPSTAPALPGSIAPAQMGPIVIADGVSQALNPPPSAISTTKEQKLADLLQQYRANAISPEQYHKQRAEILAGN